MNKVVVFDLDDTLYKEVDYVRSGFMAVAQHLGDDSLLDVMLKARSKGINAFEAVKEQRPDAEIEKMIEIYRNHKPQISLSRETMLTLDYLHSNYTLALITDGRSVGQRNKIEALGLERYFAPEDIIISEEFGSDKHSAANFKAIEKNHPGADFYFYIGDNPEKDFFRPNQLGWRTIMLEDVNHVNIHGQDNAPSIDHIAQYAIESLCDAIAIVDETEI